MHEFDIGNLRTADLNQDVAKPTRLDNRNRVYKDENVMYTAQKKDENNIINTNDSLLITGLILKPASFKKQFPIALSIPI